MQLLMLKKIKNKYIIDNNMCRLFLSINTSNILEKIILFLSQSIHHEKYTPYINNHRDGTKHMDGFGIVWFESNKIKSKEFESNKIIKYYKSPLIYYKDTEFINLLTTISSNIILGHIRQKTVSNISCHNTHPFYYNNQVFMHNGGIKDFNKNKHILLKYISKKYINLIKGNTDSELLFYLFLTFYDDFNLLKKAMYTIFILFRSLNIELSANIMYANSNYILVTRYLIYNPNDYITKQSPASLYINCSNGVIISSEPIDKTNNWDLIKENTILLIDIKNSNII